jgi:putative ABC transport system permease protein
VGLTLTLDSYNYRVIGVIKDFNFFPLHHQISPLAIFYKTENVNKSKTRYRYMFVKAKPGKASEAISYIKKVLNKYSPNYPFSFAFLENIYGRLYRSEKRLNSIITYFAAIAVIISCLGLFGLTSFMTERRCKEIGIRKVFGSSIAAVTLLLSRDYIKWVVLANLIAGPLAFFISKNWLENFAYRIRLGIEIFLLSGLLSLFLAFITVSYRVIKAASANPIDSLKYE